MALSRYRESGVIAEGLSDPRQSPGRADRIRAESHCQEGLARVGRGTHVGSRRSQCGIALLVPGETERQSRLSRHGAANGISHHDREDNPSRGTHSYHNGGVSARLPEVIGEVSQPPCQSGRRSESRRVSCRPQQTWINPLAELSWPTEPKTRGMWTTHPESASSAAYSMVGGDNPPNSWSNTTGRGEPWSPTTITSRPWSSSGKR